MKKEIIMSGFGEQGVLSMGTILAYSGLMDDKEVTWMPAYGPEQRGGTANVTVIVSDEKISSPILSKFDVAVVLNQPSLEKFEPKIKPGGILIYDGFGIINKPTRKDITIYRIDAMDKAAEMKNAKVFNMIVLGGLLKVAPVVSTKGVEKALRKTLPERHHEMIPLNMQAIEEGGKLIVKM
jgi:2-oxoglutarate ferredoxin oxidoreductase subunit gamma